MAFPFLFPSTRQVIHGCFLYLLITEIPSPLCSLGHMPFPLLGADWLVPSYPSLFTLVHVVKIPFYVLIVLEAGLSHNNKMYLNNFLSISPNWQTERETRVWSYSAWWCPQHRLFHLAEFAKISVEWVSQWMNYTWSKPLTALRTNPQLPPMASMLL